MRNWANGITFDGNQIVGVGTCLADDSDGKDLVGFIYDISGFSWGESRTYASGEQDFEGNCPQFQWLSS